jgi:hypothetical protein
MTEIKRTLIFVAIAVALTAITYFTLPKADMISPADMVGQSLFPNFQDPLTATSLEVVKFDQAAATPVSFMVRKEGNSWVIPPKNYPADAQDQLAKAAADLIELKVLSVAANPQEAGIGADDIKGLHKLYGVVDPSEKGDSSGEGIGTRVSLRDKDDTKLVDLVIGKPVEGQNGLRYVRRVGQDPVYTVKVSTDKFSTKFQDWIEKDLLKLSSWDIRKISIDDYSVDIIQQSITPRGKITLEYNDTGEPRWKMTADRVYKKEGWVEQGLSEKEELNTDTLNNLKNALDDLKIVDVMRKPASLSETLRGSGSINLDPEAERSLARAGFHVVTISDPANPGQKSYQLRSNEGEIAVTMKDGVYYVLRFGQIAGMASEEAKEAKKDKQADEKTAEKKPESSTADVNRYLFVMAEFRPEMIEKPTYEQLPELPAEQSKADEKKPEQPKAEEKKPEESKVGEKKPEQPKAEEKKPEESKVGEKKPEQPKADEKKSEQPKADEKKPEEPKADAKSDEAKPEGKPEAGKEKAAAGEESKTEKPKLSREEIEKKREEIQKENDRKKEEYEKKVKDAEKKVADLNARFAEWYYVIDDAEYQKIHLSRDKIVKAKEEKKPEEKASDASAAKPPAEPDTVADFENLKMDAPRP